MYTITKCYSSMVLIWMFVFLIEWGYLNYNYTTWREDMRSFLVLTAKFLFSMPFIVFGLFHFLNMSGMVAMVPRFLPLPQFWVCLVGIVLIGAGVCVLTDFLSSSACCVLAGMLLLIILFVHIPGIMVSSSADSSIVALLKDMGLLGGALGFHVWLSTSD